MSAETAQKYIEDWLKIDRDPNTRAEAEAALKNGEYKLIEKSMSQRMSFGTAGLRGTLQFGYNCMNEVTISQAAQGLCEYLIGLYGVGANSPLKKNGIVIAYDARRKSSDFAAITAAVFLCKQIPVRMFSHIAPTPYAAFGTRFYGCVSGVMVTASHNPSKDNGYKVYWKGGLQITPPHDKGIQACIASQKTVWDECTNENRNIIINNSKKSGLLIDPFNEDFIKTFNNAIKPLHFNTDEVNKNTPAKFAYTAMWGVGRETVVAALKSFGFDIEKNFILLPGESMPDPNFGGCARPNPEERHNMVRLTEMLNAPENKEIYGDINIALATDPDADRLAICEKQTDGTWTIFHGNEIGDLLGYWCLKNFTEKGVKKPFVCNSTVSSKNLKYIATRIFKDVKYEETLTGFKWLAHHAETAEKEGYTPCFSYEEAIGYCCGNHVRDKDGVSASCVASELVTYLYNKGLKLTDLLKTIRKEAGVVCRYNNSSIAVDSLDDVKALFYNLLNGGNGFGRKYLTQFGDYVVENIRDLQGEGFDSRTADNKPELPTSSSPMLTFYCSNNVTCTLRPSGTEPKVKYYIEAEGATEEEAQKKADDFAVQFKNAILPKSN